MERQVVHKFWCGEKRGVGGRGWKKSVIFGALSLQVCLDRALIGELWYMSSELLCQKQHNVFETWWLVVWQW